MLAKRRLLFAAVTAASLVLTTVAPMAGATRQAQPSPLRAANLLRVKDIGTNGVMKNGLVAVGYQETSRPGQLYVAWSVDGGQDYRRTNGKLRRYRVVGDPRLGMSLDACAKRVWIGTAWGNPNDRRGDSDVVLTTRTISGGAAQKLLTKTSKNHKVRDVNVSCVSGKLVAIAWLQQSGPQARVKLLLRSVDDLSDKATYRQTFDVGPAEYQSGLALTSTPDQVSLAFVRNGDLYLHRLAIADDKAAGAGSQKRIVWDDVKYPQLAAHRNRLAVVYSDAGKVKAKLSEDAGASVSKPQVLAWAGSKRNPSKPHSVDVQGKRVVSTASVYKNGKTTPQRFSSSDFGQSWRTASFGNVGARMASLLKIKGQPSLLMEAWHNNAPKGISDTLRARYEVR
jgi:hypothetical protein